MNPSQEAGVASIECQYCCHNLFGFDADISMEEIRSVIHRFPERELNIRRCFARDASFRALCSDYREASWALDHWNQRQKDPQGERIAQDYKNLVVELEQEILRHLQRFP
jgi:hypothetical protein